MDLTELFFIFKRAVRLNQVGQVSIHHPLDNTQYYLTLLIYKKDIKKHVLICTQTPGIIPLLFSTLFK